MVDLKILSLFQYSTYSANLIHTLFWKIIDLPPTARNYNYGIRTGITWTWQKSLASTSRMFWILQKKYIKVLIPYKILITQPINQKNLRPTLKA